MTLWSEQAGASGRVPKKEKNSTENSVEKG